MFNASITGIDVDIQHTQRSTKEIAAKIIPFILATSTGYCAMSKLMPLAEDSSKLKLACDMLVARGWISIKDEGVVICDNKT